MISKGISVLIFVLACTGVFGSSVYDGLEFSTSRKVAARKWFLLLGAKGTGKSAFINAMINPIRRPRQQCGRPKHYNESSRQEAKTDLAKLEAEVLNLGAKRPLPLVEYKTPELSLPNYGKIQFHFMESPGFFFDEEDDSMITESFESGVFALGNTLHGLLLVHRANRFLKYPARDLIEIFKIVANKKLTPSNIGILITHTDELPEAMKQNYSAKIFQQLESTKLVKQEHIFHVNFQFLDELKSSCRQAYMAGAKSEIDRTTHFLQQFDETVNVAKLIFGTKHFKESVWTDLHGSAVQVSTVWVFVLGATLAVVFALRKKFQRKSLHSTEQQESRPRDEMDGSQLNKKKTTQKKKPRK